MNGIDNNNPDERGLLPFPVILAATKGDPDAMKIVLQHYAKVTEAEQKLLSLLLEDPAYTYAVLAEKLGLSRKTISSRIKSLKDKGVLQRVGSDTKGHWQSKNGK